MAGRIARRLPPAALAAGVLLFAFALFVLGIEAAGEKPSPLDPASLTAQNGTAVLAYPAPPMGGRSARIEVTYAFPDAPGDAYFLGCDDLDAVKRGDAPAAPMLSFTGLQSGSFVVSPQTAPTRAPSMATDARAGLPRCDSAVAFVWRVAGDDPSENRPTASVERYHGSFDMQRYGLFLLIMASGALLALVGGLAWARGPPSPPPGGGDYPLEVLRASLDRLGTQLERTRGHLLFAGIFGVFLWYPVLVPWAWKQAKLTSDGVLFPWAVAGLTLAFLVVLTLLWGRELHRLDRELVAWRARMSELRERETTLMDAL